MRVVVDLTKCQGYGQCAFLAPSTFVMDGEEGLHFVAEPPEGERERVLRAAAACPVQAIAMELAANGQPLASQAERADAGVIEGGIVVVGASLAGLRAAETLRSEGYAGPLTLIGDEPGEAYDRPPLSKHVLTGLVEAHATLLPRLRELDARRLFGVAATGLDLAAKRVRLADGAEVAFERLLIATGVRSRRWPNAEEAALTGVVSIRTPHDAAALRSMLAAAPRRVLVIGAGFAGSEVASVCRELGLPVTVAEAGAAPLVGALGQVVGAVAAGIQREHGVDLRCGVMVTALDGDADGRLVRAHLSDGTVLDVEVAVCALGGVRNVEWLAGSGLAAGEWGVACDAGCRAFDVNGLVTDDVFVAGDVARAPHPVYGYSFLALEHWGNAVTQAEVAAHNMVRPSSERWPHLSIPEFWSTQFGYNIKSVGVPSFSDEIVIAQGSVEARRFVAVYGHRGRITAAVSFDQGMWLDFWRDQIEDAAPFPPTFTLVGAPTDGPVGVRPAGFPEPNVPSHEATVVVTGYAPSDRRARFAQVR
jgi:3-phenylpropionate/trans-cinnamate dioxygenase ferredoxin reductase component